MNKKTIGLLLLISISHFLSFSQIGDNKQLQIIPYVGLSSPQGDFKDFSDNGNVFGISIDKYISSKFALGLDINFQSNSFKMPFDYSLIPNIYGIISIEQGKWNATALTFGPTYKIGSKKFSVELYSKAGILYIKSPSSKSIFQYSGGEKEIFSLPEQERTSFGFTSGIRFNYKVSNSLSVFFNPQYVSSSAKVDYCNCGVDEIVLSNGTIDLPALIEKTPVLESVKPSYLNLNVGVKFDLGKSKDANSVNRSIPICDISFVQVECNGLVTTLKLSQFWNNFNSNFTSTVEVFNGTTLINPTTSSPQILGQINGTIPFYTSINNNLIGASLTAVIKIFDTNGNLVCTKDTSFTVSPCAPQPTSCSFDLDINNVTCNSNFITYNATSTWSNVTVGSSIEIVAYESPSGTSIPLVVSPNLPITVTTANTIGSASHAVSIPSSYNGTPINITMKITDPTTGFVKNCGFSDLFTPLCEPSDCDWQYNVTCDPINKGIKINVTSTWNGMPSGSILNYSLINQIGGAPIPFTVLPNNLPQTIGGNGVSSHTLYINSSYSNALVVFKMEIDDGNGAVICNKGKDIILPSCVFKTCELIEKEASCKKGQPYIAFSVDWDNYTNFSNYSIYLDAKDQSGNPIAGFNSVFNLTGSSGSMLYNMNLLAQYAGTTIIINSRICETISGGIKNCCESALKIDIPKCCETCTDVIVKDNTDPNQYILNNFVFTGVISSTSPTAIEKVVAQLEYISFDNNTTIVVPTNFEFIKSLFMNTNGTYNGTLIGSLLGDRSNMIVTEILPPNSANTIFRLFVDSYTNNSKRVTGYRVKLTIFKDDGTYCEEYLQM